MSQRNPIKPLRSRLAGLGLVVAVAHTISSRGYDSTGRSGGRVGFFLVAEALCPNSCSGHGTCGSDDVCHCYPDWGAVDAGSGDCSERYCPHEIAFVDFPDSLGNFHKYAECSAKGLCDRSSGECECFDGYTGKGCQRKTCPGEADGMPGVWCSGHGSCEFLDETTYGDHPGLYFDGSVKGLDGFVTPGIHDSFGIGFKAKADRMWESKKLMHCVCDGGWSGPDCSLRLCPRGNDPVHQRLNRADILKNHIQNITMYAAGPYANGNESTIDEFYGSTFALSFTSQLNETFTTIPIEVKRMDSLTDTENKLAQSIKFALEALPMKICPQVFINLTMGYDAMFDPYQSTTGFISNDDMAYIHFTAEFSGLLMGDQKLLTVHHEECRFCTPQLTGMRLVTHTRSFHDPTTTPKNSFVAEKQDADYNNYECGRRGKCDFDTGICDCFEGFEGEACQTQTQLI